MLHRLHFSREKLARIYPDEDPACPRCNYNLATVGHMFWAYPQLDNYWRQIFEILSRVRGQDLYPDFRIGVFGVAASNYKLNRFQADAIAFASLIARRLFCRNS